MTANQFQNVRVIFFDFMGTCLDWHTNIVKALPKHLENDTRSNFALDWRQAFFNDIERRFSEGLPPEDIDLSHARLLDDLLRQPKWSNITINEDGKKNAVHAWHHMTAWPDVERGLSRLKGKYEVFVLANGTTRLQLDLTRSSRLQFDMLFSSQLLDLSKPNPEIYQKALNLVGCSETEAIMIAAHAYDLRAAQKVGLKTAYIQRWTEDRLESMSRLEKEFDIFVDGRDGTTTCGLAKIANILGV